MCCVSLFSTYRSSVQLKLNLSYVCLMSHVFSVSRYEVSVHLVSPSRIYPNVENQRNHQRVNFKGRVKLLCLDQVRLKFEHRVSAHEYSLNNFEYDFECTRPFGRTRKTRLNNSVHNTMYAIGGVSRGIPKTLKLTRCSSFFSSRRCSD